MTATAMAADNSIRNMLLEDSLRHKHIVHTHTKLNGKEEEEEEEEGEEEDHKLKWKSLSADW